MIDHYARIKNNSRTLVINIELADGKTVFLQPGQSIEDVDVKNFHHSYRSALGLEKGKGVRKPVEPLPMPVVEKEEEISMKLVEVRKRDDSKRLDEVRPEPSKEKEVSE